MNVPDKLTIPVMFFLTLPTLNKAAQRLLIYILSTYDSDTGIVFVTHSKIIEFSQELKKKYHGITFPVTMNPADFSRGRKLLIKLGWITGNDVPGVYTINKRLVALNLNNDQQSAIVSQHRDRDL